MSRLIRLIVPAGMLLALALAAPCRRRQRPGRLAGWQWGNPLPQGNTSASIAFCGASGYAVGDFGTILATDDGGATWRGLVSGTLAEPAEVQAIDGNSLFAGGGCVGRRSDDGGKTFTRVAFTPVETNCRQPLAAAWFATEQTGYIVLADGTTLRTDNNGQTLRSQDADPGHAARPAAPPSPPTSSSPAPTRASPRPPAARSTARPTARTRGPLAVDYGRTVQSFALAGTTVIAAGDQGAPALEQRRRRDVERRRQGRASARSTSPASAARARDLCVMTTAAGNGQPGNDLIRFDTRR